MKWLPQKAQDTKMLAKLTSKNQITLPKAVISRIDATEYFDVAVENNRIVLTPVRVQTTKAVREKLEQLGITEQDVEDAVAWARR
ncbi:MAG: AbrB/MazE/SpoVT family DNA-binding domain-containing protein [Zoogloeaceae bacterium]|jgi:bifunctional DNA-binding transcriptional regulator/antitoxin component of YhaV-PrlF toxin-antitoxin module|nr:AbrB/MazE/SpoVT family DNA-binding domain-containing protein [Zoogloeaceae bacterium]